MDKSSEAATQTEAAAIDLATETVPIGIPVSGRLVFRAMRNGSPLGKHQVTFARQANSLTVDIAVDYAVKLAFITVFRYRLRVREKWSGKVLMSVRAETDNNGKPEFMRADRDGNALIVEGSGTERYRAPDKALVASHWNKVQLAAPMINPQDGTLLRSAVTSRGPAKVADAAGTLRTAEHFALTGEDPLELWYDTTNVWTSLRAKVRDGSTVTYLRID